MMFHIKRYVIVVDGFDGHSYFAASAGKARAMAWRSYCHYRQISFGDFLRISRTMHMGGSGDPRFGKPILVGGAPAFFVEDDRQYVHFVRPGADQIMLSHPLDVEWRIA